MDSVGPELGKLAGQVYRHDLTGKLEAALRASNAQVWWWLVGVWGLVACVACGFLTWGGMDGGW